MNSGLVLGRVLGSLQTTLFVNFLQVSYFCEMLHSFTELFFPSSFMFIRSSSVNPTI